MEHLEYLNTRFRTFLQKVATPDDHNWVLSCDCENGTRYRIELQHKNGDLKRAYPETWLRGPAFGFYLNGLMDTVDTAFDLIWPNPRKG